MAVKTSTASGNASSGAVWVGGVAPTTGDQIVIASGHAVVIDVTLDLGVSPPQTPAVRPTINLTTGATVTSLPTGTYLWNYTFVDAAGKESACVIGDQSTGALTTGSSKPRVTFAALPAGVSSRNLYLTDTGGAAGTGHLYATGITGTTYDIVSASYTDGTTTYAAAAAIPNQLAVKVNGTGSLAIDGTTTAVTLTSRGDFWLANAQVTFKGAAILEFNPASANSPTNAGYFLWGGSGSTQTAVKILTASTSSGSRAEIRTAAGSYKAASILPYLTAFGNASDSFFFNVAYMNFTRLGDSASNAITFLPSTSTVVNTFDHCIFDTCASVKWTNYPPAGGGWSITNCSFKNSVASTFPVTLISNAVPTTGLRLLDHSTFDIAPTLGTLGCTYTNNYFDNSFAIQSGTNKWASFDSNAVRNTADGNGAQGIPSSGDVTNCVVFSDSASGIGPTVSGTATAGGATTLTDSSKTWTVNAYSASAGGVTTGWGVYITGGTGAGQGRMILSNTATILTVSRAWDVNPDSTSTYRIYGAVANPRYVAASAAPASSTIALTGNIVQLIGFDNFGDVFVYNNSASSTYTITGNIVLPSVARDCTGTLITLFNTNDNQTFTVNHNTYFTGGESAAVNEGGKLYTVTSATTTVLTVSSAAAVGVGDQIKFSPTTTTTALQGVTATVLSKTTTTITLSAALGATPVAGDVFASTQQPGRVPAFKSNIAWCETGKTYLHEGGGGGYGPYKLFSVFVGGRANETTDIVTVTAGVSDADYNCGFGHKTDGYSDTNNAGGGGGYDVNSSVAMGTHDVNGDPQFVDRWRSIWGWAGTLASTGDPFELIADMRARLKAINDVNDVNYDARYTIAALRTYIIAGLAPQNAALHNTGHDGTDIGAIAYQSSSTGGPFPFFMSGLSGGLRNLPGGFEG